MSRRLLAIPVLLVALLAFVVTTGSAADEPKAAELRLAVPGVERGAQSRPAAVTVRNGGDAARTYIIRATADRGAGAQAVKVRITSADAVVYDGLVEELPARLDGRRVELAPGAARSYRATLYLPATAPAGYAGDAAGITLTIG